MKFNKGNDYIDYVDGLRAFAVIVVLLFHLNVPLIKGGFVGVDVFFVISGFLITRLIIKEIEHTGTFSFIDFYCRRIRRIFPALFFILLCTWVAGMLLFSPGHFRALGGTIASAALSLSNVLFWRESGYFDAASEYKPLLHTWSLGVEEQFYFVWPFILFMVATRKYKKFLLPAIITLGIISLSLNIGLQKNHLNALYYLMPFRFFEFCIGAITVWLIQYRPKSPLVEELLCVMGLVFLLCSVILFNKNLVFPSYNALIPTIGAALIIYAGNARYSGRIFSNKIAIAFGLISYSLYLVHWPIIVFYSYFINTEITSLKAQGLIVFYSISFAVFIYYFIEQPFRGTASKDRRTQLLLLAKWTPSIAFTACLGLVLHASNGWLWRIPESMRLQYSNEEMAQNYHQSHFGGQGFPYPFGWTYKTESKEPDIVLLGDSHAQMLQYGLFHEIAKKYHQSIYMAGSSCLILPGVFRTTVGQNWKTLCKEVLKHGLSELNKKNDSIMILSQSWLFQILRAASIIKDEPWNINLQSTNKRDYLPLLAKLEELRELIANRTLIIIGDVPGAGIKDPFSCLTRPTLSKANCIQKIDVSRDTNIQAQNINKILKYFANHHKNTYFFDPYTVFCTKKICHALSAQGKPYYSDNNHLSEIGSKYFIAQLKQQLIPIILHQQTEID